MTFNDALTTAQYITLRGNGAQSPSYQSATYLSVNPNTLVLACQVNQSAFGSSYAEFLYDNVTTGAYTDVVVGMTVIICPTNDITNAIFTGRIRKTITSNILYINETSAPLANNYYVFVIADFREWDKLGRQLNQIQYTDYDIAFRQLLPVVYDLNTAYAGWVSGGVLTIAFTPNALAPTSGATISSWLWDVSDGTITVGSDTDQNITATFPPGHRYIYLTVTDSGGRALTRKISIHAHDLDLYPPVPLQAGDISVSASVDNGYEASITAWAGVEDVLDNTLLVIWKDEQYQDDSAALTGDNIAFIGRFRQSTDSALADAVSGIAADTRYAVEGAMQALARLEMLPYEFLNAASPTAFFQVKTLTIWRAVCLLLSEFSTFLEIHSLSFDSTADSFLTIGLRTQGNNILSAVNDLYYSINGGMQINAAGQAQCVRDLRMVSDTLRNAAPTIANWTTSDILDLQYNHANVRTVGRLMATGGSFIAANNQNNTFQSLSPGVAQDYPEGSATLDRQVLQANQSEPNAQTELNTRAGYAFARAQETDSITITHPDGYNWLTCALDQWFTFTLDGSETVRGIVLTTDTRWLLTGVDIQYDGVTGQTPVKATYTRETTGAAGQTVVYPPAPETPYESPSFPPFDLFPAFPVDPSFYLPPDEVVVPYIGNPDLNQTTAPMDGNGLALIDLDNNVLYITANLLTSGTNPTWVDITPDNITGDLKYIRSPGGSALYAVANDGTDSSFHYTANAYANPVTWVDTDLTGALYDYIRPASAPGGVYIEGVNSDTSACNVDTWDVIDGTHGTIDSRTDTSITMSSGPLIADDYFIIVTVGGSLSTPADSFCAIPHITILSGGGDATLQSGVPCGGAYPGDFVSPVVGPMCSWFVQFQTNEPYTARIDFTFDECSDCATSETLIAYSDDFGATFAAPESVAALSPPGFDTIKIGLPSLVGTPGQVYISTTAGGAYTPYGTLFPSGGEPNALLIPRFQFGSSSSGNVSTNTPEYLAASGTLAADGEALWKVTTSGSLFTGITPVRSSVEGLAIGRDSIEMSWQNAARILEVADFSGTVRLAVTVNTGSNWTFSSALSADAYALRVRKGDSQNKQAFIGNGSAVAYVANYRAATLTYSNKNYPGGVIGAIEVFG